jgi:hypothetical protein
MSKNIEDQDSRHAQIMAELIHDPNTTDHLRVSIINELLKTRDNPDFFPTIFEEFMSHGACPCCGHENHWLIPESSLNKLGYVTSEEDPEVPADTDAENCPTWEEACAKKKVSI